MRYYDYPTKEKEDVHIELADLEKVKYGDTFKGRVMLEVWNMNIMDRSKCVSRIISGSNQ